MSEEDHGKKNAIAFLESLIEAFEELDPLREADDWDAAEELEERLREHALSVEVRSAWAVSSSEFYPEEYRILTAWGGPACQVRGTLNYGTPTTAEIQYQDWGTPWTTLDIYGYLLEKEGDQPGPLDRALELDQLVLRFAQLFYFED